ncbi:MAG: HD domain-containing protein [bacterium]|nr:HD domain-containing protein [bacterium]
MEKVNKGIEIPKEVLKVSEDLQKAGFEAYLIGGCVRDVLRETEPKDWDLTTNATPEEIVKLFPHTFYENNFGTVGIVNEETTNEKLKVVEVTTYRLEADYSNARHPDHVTFSKNIEDDLKRRDFTINAIALDPHKGQIIDLYKGQEDLKAGIIRAVGDPEERFSEDALRMLRAVRLSSELGFHVEPETEKAIQNKAILLEKISKERIRDEFCRILLSDKPMDGLLLAKKLAILKYIAKDLERGIGVEQNQAHKYDVFEHNMRTLQHAADKKYGLDLRLASLFHDVSKPETRRFSKEKNDWTFYGHDVVGARLTKKILAELKFPNKTIDKIVKLVRWHMFFSDPEQITLSAVRRLIANVGKEDVWELMNLRICDRIGTGRPKENPYRFRKYKSMVEEALEDPVTVGMLRIKGNQLMSVLGIAPGPKIGYILHALFEEVLDKPELNTLEYLEKRAGELNQLEISELEKLGKQGKEKKEEEQVKKVKEIRKKYYVE